jgi:hypothetical protein
MLGIQELRPKPIERGFGLTPVVEWDVSLKRHFGVEENNRTLAAE